MNNKNIQKKGCRIVSIGSYFPSNIVSNNEISKLTSTSDKLQNAREILDGDNILFAAVGSGWTWGAGVLQWSST